MRVRHILALGAVLGAFGGADLQRAQAQSVSVKTVRFLLLQEAGQIGKASIAIAQQNYAIGVLNVLYATIPEVTTQSQANFLRGKISHYRTVAFNTERIIERYQVSLQNLDNRTLTAVQAFDPSGTTPYTVQAFNNDVTISGIVSRPPYGITPVSPTG
jgi:hypothetical protein